MQETHSCKLILETFNDNPFLPMFYKDPQRYAFTVELFFMTERHKQLQNHLLSQDLFYDFTMSDYYFTKTLLFARNNLEEEEFRLFQKLYKVLNQTFPQPDLLVYFHRHVDILMDNIKKRNRDFEKNISKDYLIKIQNAYFEYFRNILSFPVVILDLGDIDFVNNEKAFHEVKSLLYKEYTPGVHRMTLRM
jgi:deoxyadenosine/deoxycytidine kinase